MCRLLLPEPEETIGPPQHLMAVWSLATIQEVEGRDDVQAWIRDTLQHRVENLSRQLPACQCGLLSQVGQAMVHRLAYEVALVTTGGDPLAALQALWKAVHHARLQGVSLRGIARELGISRNTVRKYVDLPAPPINRTCRRAAHLATQDKTNGHFP